MRESSLPPAAHYLSAIALVAAAVAIRWLLDPWLEGSLALVTLFGAVAISQWLGGYGPALLATIAGYAASDYLFIGPQGTLGFDTSASLIGFVAYLGSSGTIIGFGEAMRRARRRAAERQRLLSVTLANIGDSVIATDRKGRISYLNPVAASLTRWTPQGAVGQPLETVFCVEREGSPQSVGESGAPPLSHQRPARCSRS
jgi:K+-sensing histidine kinase KdpD